MSRISFIVIFLFFQQSLIQSQNLKLEQDVFINSFIDKLNQTDTVDLGSLITYKEVRGFLKSQKKQLPLLMLEKAHEDAKILKLLEDCIWDCYYIENKKIRLSQEELKFIHQLDSAKIHFIQKKLRERHDSITNSFFQRYINYREFILSKKDTAGWRKLLGCQICDEELLKIGNDAISFYRLPADYKWMVGRFKKLSADGLNVKLYKLEYPDIDNQNGFIIAEPIVTLMNEKGTSVRIKLHLLYHNNSWKIYREPIYK